jgi:tripartite-type tricarboxylate transporter receptor subunit TctC
MLTRRTLLAATAAAAAVPLASARAQAWPTRPVTFLNGAPAGSTIDFVARLLADQLTNRLGQQVLVENRPGASFNIATQAMLRAPADGYTIGFAPITMGTNPALMDIGYDPLKDVTMVTQISAIPVVIVVGAHTPYRTLAEFVAFAKANPEKVTLGHGGTGTSGFLAAQLFAREAGFKVLPVPYGGTAPIFTAMLGGQIDGTFTPVDPSIPGHVAAGRMRVLGVMQPKRIAVLPDVPTTHEQGFGAAVDFRSWHGIMVRAGTPQPVVDRLYAEVHAIVGTPAVRERLAASGVEPALSASQAEFDAFYRGEIARWTELVRALNLKPQ